MKPVVLEELIYTIHNMCRMLRNYHWWIVMLDSSGYLHALGHSMTCHHILYHKIYFMVLWYLYIFIYDIYFQKFINIVRMLFLYYKYTYYCLYERYYLDMFNQEDQVCILSRVISDLKRVPLRP